MISRNNIDYIRETVAAYAGIRIEAEEEFLIESGLLPLARQQGTGSANELVRLMQQGSIQNAAQVLAETLVDTETYFFRDIRPFEALRQNVLPVLKAKRSTEKKLTIWCVGCSTGQEPYSIALLIQEYFPELLTWNLEILGCDLSLEAAQAGAAGGYNQIEVNRGLPSALLVKYFQREGLVWKLKDEIIKRVQFSQINLAEKWPKTEKFDIILLRNVLSGLVPELQAEIIKKMQRRLAPGGFLFLGVKETPPGIADCFEQVQFDKVVCYRPKPLPPGSDKDDEEGEDDAQWEKAPSNWAKLALLATGFGSVDAEKAAKAFESDSEITQRILRAGIQGKAGEAPHESLQGAFSKIPKEQLMAVALVEPMRKALDDAFMAMLSAGVETISLDEIKTPWKRQIVATSKISEGVSGRICIRFEPDVAQALSGEVLGLAPEDIGPEAITEMIGQFAEIVATNFETNLKAGTLTCKKEPAVVAEGGDSILEISSKVFHEPLALKYEDKIIRADVIINAFQRK
ncbi:MAG: protein-glutamate O-methyltransferase CheR [Verrucomicrobia bacterium]|nr:protein-glutamate O-methyltransferase CheR [Verrucomicrobiota bacterium]